MEYTLSEVMRNKKIAEREEKEFPVKEIYDLIQLRPGRLFPAPGKPAAYYLMSRDGHRIILTGFKTCFDFDDPELHERLRNEEGVKMVVCKNRHCQNDIALIVKAWTESETLKNMGSLVHCCAKCLTIIVGAPRKFRHGRLT